MGKKKWSPIGKQMQPHRRRQMIEFAKAILEDADKEGNVADLDDYWYPFGRHYAINFWVVGNEIRVRYSVRDGWDSCVPPLRLFTATWEPNKQPTVLNATETTR